MIVLAHGAGGSMDDPLLVDLSAALVARGFGVARFNFRYRDEGRKIPDRAPVLEATFMEELESLRARAPRKSLRWIIGGKSMGGRMASHLMARPTPPPARGLLLLGYPLHPPKKTTALRSEHLPALRVPTLFLQGTRDPLCDLKLLRRAIRPMGERATLEIVKEGDHSLAVPKRLAVRADHIASLADRIERWAVAIGRAS